jgi:hypothetical protein
MAIYKVSYVISGSDHPGAIYNQDQPPKPGDTVFLGNLKVEIIEVLDLVPPRGGFYYLHATCRPVKVEETTRDKTKP